MGICLAEEVMAEAEAEVGGTPVLLGVGELLRSSAARPQGDVAGVFSVAGTGAKDTGSRDGLRSMDGLGCACHSPLPTVDSVDDLPTIATSTMISTMTTITTSSLEDGHGVAWVCWGGDTQGECREADSCHYIRMVGDTEGLVVAVLIGRMMRMSMMNSRTKEGGSGMMKGVWMSLRIFMGR